MLMSMVMLMLMLMLTIMVNANVNGLTVAKGLYGPITLQMFSIHCPLFQLLGRGEMLKT